MISYYKYADYHQWGNYKMDLLKQEIQDLLSTIEQNPQNYDNEFIAFAKNKLGVATTEDELKDVKTCLEAILEGITLEEYNKGTLNEDNYFSQDIKAALQSLEEQDVPGQLSAEAIKNDKQQKALTVKTINDKINFIKSEIEELNNLTKTKLEQLRDERQKLSNIGRS